MRRFVRVLSLAGVILVLPPTEAARDGHLPGKTETRGRLAYEVPLDGSTLRVETSNGLSRGDLRRFVVPTAHGPLRGEIFPGDDEVVVIVSSTSETAVITYANEPNGSLSALVRFSGHGSIHLEFHEAGVFVVENAVRDCSALASGLLAK